jgi:hypothetical protein
MQLCKHYIPNEKDYDVNLITVLLHKLIVKCLGALNDLINFIFRLFHKKAKGVSCVEFKFTTLVVGSRTCGSE